MRTPSLSAILSARIRFLAAAPILLFALLLAACPSPESESAEQSADSVTQRERYEGVGRSNLPGAQGVQGALDASDDIRSREAQRDSVLRGQ